MLLADREITLLGEAITSLRTEAFANRLRDLINCVVPVDITLVCGFSANTIPVELFRDFDAHSEREYLKHYALGAYLLDPFYHISIKRRASGFYTIREIAPDRFFQSEYYASYYSKLPLIDEIGLVHHVSEDWSFVYSMGRTPGSGPYSARETARLRRLFPVLRALMLVHWTATLLASDNREKTAELNEMTNRIFAHAKTLAPKGISPREAEVAALILQGHSNHSIAALLNIALGTVKVLRKRLYAKPPSCLSRRRMNFTEFCFRPSWDRHRI